MAKLAIVRKTIVIFCLHGAPEGKTQNHHGYLNSGRCRGGWIKIAADQSILSYLDFRTTKTENARPANQFFPKLYTIQFYKRSLKICVEFEHNDSPYKSFQCIRLTLVYLYSSKDEKSYFHARGKSIPS